MKIQDIDLEAIIDLYSEVFLPVRFINSRMRAWPIETPQSIIAKFWLPPAILVLSLDILVFHFLGYEAGKDQILLDYLTVIQLIAFMVPPLITWLLTTLTRDHIEWHQIVIAFTPLVLSGPFTTLLALPNIVRRFALTNFFVHEHMGIPASFTFMLVNKGRIDTAIGGWANVWNACAVPFSIIFSTFLTVIAAETLLVKASKSSRFRIYIIASSATMLAGFPQGMLEYVQLGLTASYAPASSVFDQFRKPEFSR